MAQPPIVAGKNTRIFLHSRNVSCLSASVDGTMTMPMLDAPTFCGIVRVPGLQDGKYSIRGYWGRDDPTLEEKLSQIFSGAISPAYFVDAPYCAADYPCYGGEIKGSTVKVATPSENVITVEGELTLQTPDRTYSQGFGPAFRGRILYYAGDGGVTFAGGVATTYGSAVTMGPSVAGKVHASFHLSWVPPLTDFVSLSVQHSANGTSGWVTFPGSTITLKAEAMGPGDGVLTANWYLVTEDPYWRVVLTHAGSNAKQFFNLFVWATVNTGAGTEGTFVIVADSDSTEWVEDTDAADWVIK